MRTPTSIRRTSVVLATSAFVIGLGLQPALAQDAKPTTVEVQLTDAGCPRKLRAPAGKIRFDVTNVDAASVSEFEVLKGDGILGKRENLAPGLSAEFTLTLKAGRYTTYCPGGERERGKLIVKGSTDLEASKVGECVPVGDPATATDATDVTLDEWVIDFGHADLTAGQVAIAATNEGNRAHEVVVLQGVEADALPVGDDGSIDEAALPDGTLVGEIEPFAAGTDCTGVFALDPGEYVIVCNITEKPNSKKPVSHLAKGMLTTLTVG